MSNIKLSIQVMTILVLASACVSTVPVEISPTPPVPPDTALPTSTPIEGVSTLAPSPSPTLPDSLSVGFIDYMRILTASGADLSSQSANEAIAKQFQQIILTESQADVWPGGTANGTHSFMLDIHIASQSSPDTNTVKYPLHVSISQAEMVPYEHIILGAPGGGGGGEMRDYAPIPLAAGEMDLTSKDSSPVTLTSAENPAIYFSFSMVCQQPGIFTVTFSIPFTLSSSLTNEILYPYTISLYCPTSSVLWLLDAQTGQFTNMGRFVFQNGRYIQQP